MKATLKQLSAKKADAIEEQEGPEIFLKLAISSICQALVKKGLLTEDELCQAFIKEVDEYQKEEPEEPNKQAEEK